MSLKKKHTFEERLPLILAFIIPILIMVGVFAGAAVTHLLGKWTDGGNLGLGFAVLGCIVLVALVLQLSCMKPTTDNKE